MCTEPPCPHINHANIEFSRVVERASSGSLEGCQDTSLPSSTMRKTKMSEKMTLLSWKRGGTEKRGGGEGFEQGNAG